MMKHARKTLSRLAAMFLSVMLLAALAIVPAAAAPLDKEGIYDGTAITEFSFDKKLTLPEGVTTVPGISFTFTMTGVAPDTDEAITDSTGNTIPVSSGVGTITGDSVTATATFTAGGDSTATVNVSLQNFHFDQPGVYKYTLTETPVTGYSTAAPHNVYLYVERIDGVLGVTGVVMQTIPTDSSKPTKTDTITNSYDADTTLTISKKVTGAMGNTSDTTDFVFTVYVKGAENRPINAVHSDGDAVSFTWNDTNGWSATIELSHDEDVTIYGLLPGDVYTVEETSYTSDGYTTTINGNNGSTIKGTVDEDGTNVTLDFVNNRNAVSPTGIITTFAPYALMVVVAAAACFFFLRRRNTAED